ncbi:biogenesis of lysosome-related organelles complex 1 subunit 6-like isoform X2 [Biomphalaria glabrata]|uniref:Biogenesis of lysosome-related organelles complex 1 subunit 6-like isoform X1 n=1 Tax=Biomphalaria glabrata TaxID=6526 RepID=A0A9W2ZED5_BIOGL|nr:biogenesis of lysosome-related organelles complex 1 subunit 6-like isoform X1 [Biomphalaria glabrata]XP_055873325.1 biogenesis of lysosome-related organelles complex 1 subunit 6-like isoform X1 [Biomphalaria glabrata]XP_055873326.1 biogenesis of lysosome-related organelles complex 1 subunit 6-like isoform X1 [Biomphalaria glabrata]XP_055873327.1 biogenesis of lysosome-related organelles complex 1 subunit 6-like isoform X1 [Biomphalaria glabrata]KAI8752052.1 biogenesis of lysosome-related org
MDSSKAEPDQIVQDPSLNALETEKDIKDSPESAALECASKEKGSIEIESTKPDGEANEGEVMPNSLKLTYVTELLMNNIYYDTDVSIDSHTIQLLTDGFMAKFLPSLQKAKSTIDQIKNSQSVLIETVSQEISKFTECHALKDLDKTMAKAKLYQSKLMKLRKEMTNLHEKSRKLKKRALKLQQQKQKEELTRAHNLEKEYEKERMLTARLAPASE